MALKQGRAADGVEEKEGAGIIEVVGCGSCGILVDWSLLASSMIDDTVSRKSLIFSPTSTISGSGCSGGGELPELSGGG